MCATDDVIAVHRIRRYTYDRDGSKHVYQNFSLPYMDSIDKSLWSATVDGVELLGAPAEQLAKGKVADVPMLFGTNRDEGSTFTGNQTGACVCVRVRVHVCACVCCCKPWEEKSST